MALLNRYQKLGSKSFNRDLPSAQSMAGGGLPATDFFLIFIFYFWNVSDGDCHFRCFTALIFGFLKNLNFYNI